VPGVRSFPVGNYLIFYRETGQGVEIIRVLHGATNVSRTTHEVSRPLLTPDEAVPDERPIT
jgi:toxin ParE1/3/4